MKLLMTLCLLLTTQIVGAVEPNRYYQTVSNKLLDALHERLVDGALNNQALEEAVTIAQGTQNGPIVSQSNVSAKTTAGLVLLNQNGLTAIDKCREMVHDIDVVAAYWSQSIPGAQNPNGPEIARQIDEANARHRVKIDEVKKALSALPVSTEYTLSARFVGRCIGQEWWQQKRSALLFQIAQSAGGQLPQDLIQQLESALSRDAVMRPLILGYMTACDENELKDLVESDSNSLMFKAIQVALREAAEMDREINFIISVVVKQYQINNAKR